MSRDLPRQQPRRERTGIAERLAVGTDGRPHRRFIDHAYVHLVDRQPNRSAVRCASSLVEERRVLRAHDERVEVPRPGTGRVASISPESMPALDITPTGTSLPVEPDRLGELLVDGVERATRRSPRPVWVARAAAPRLRISGAPRPGSTSSRGRGSGGRSGCDHT